MAKKKSNNTDPTMRMPGLLLWFFCAPLALIISANHEANRQIARKRAKKARKDAEFRRKYPEWWFYSE